MIDRRAFIGTLAAPLVGKPGASPASEKRDLDPYRALERLTILVGRTTMDLMAEYSSCFNDVIRNQESSPMQGRGVVDFPICQLQPELGHLKKPSFEKKIALRNVAVVLDRLVRVTMRLNDGVLATLDSACGAVAMAICEQVSRDVASMRVERGRKETLAPIILVVRRHVVPRAQYSKKAGLEIGTFIHGDDEGVLATSEMLYGCGILV